jgi:hypothetical protein
MAAGAATEVKFGPLLRTIPNKSLGSPNVHLDSRAAQLLPKKTMHIFILNKNDDMVL